MKRRMLIVLVIAWVLYLLAVNVVLLPGIGPDLFSRHPERFHIAWSRAWTILPGVVHVRGLDLGGHSRTTLWDLHVDRGRVFVNLAALPFRTFHGILPRASGVDLQLTKAETELKPRKTTPGWRIAFSWAKVDAIRPIALFDHTIEGDIRASGGVSTRARADFGLPGALLVIGNGRITGPGAVLAEDLDLHARISIDAYDPGGGAPGGPLPHASGRLRVVGELADLSFLDAYLASTAALSFHGGAGLVEADLHLDDGRMVDPSWLETSRSTYRFSYLDYTVDGTGRILMGERTGTDGEVLRFELEQFSLGRTGGGDPYLIGSELTVAALADTIDLREVGEQVGLRVRLVGGEVTELQAYNYYLPADAGLRFVSGTGEVTSTMDLDPLTDRGHILFRLVADDIGAAFEGRELEGDLAVDLEISTDDLAARRFAIDRAEIAVAEAGVVFASGETTIPENWWAEIAVDRGAIGLAPPWDFSADVRLQARDAGPLFALITKRRSIASKLNAWIHTENLEGTATIERTAGALILHSAHVEGGKVALDAVTCLEGDASEGVILAGYGSNRTAIAFDADDTDFTLRHSENWYQKRLAELVCAEATEESP
jgi:hypothetical protein